MMKILKKITTENKPSELIDKIEKKNNIEWNLTRYRFRLDDKKYHNENNQVN